MTLKHLDATGLRDYLASLRPRIVVVRVRVRDVRIVWAVPLWAIEETVAFALGALDLLAVAWPRLPEGLRTRLSRLEGVVRPAGSAGGLRDLLGVVDELAGGRARDILRLPSGVPFVSVTTGEAHVEITQL